MRALILAIAVALVFAACGGREIVLGSVEPEGELVTETTTNCRVIDSCSAVGRCVYDAKIDVCIVGSDADCLQAEVCLLGGLCTLKAYLIDPGWNKCVAASDVDCQLGEICINDGYCTAKNGHCIK